MAGLEKVVVSTDIEEILGLSEFAERRPKELCADNSPIEDTVAYVLSKHPGYEGVVLLNPTHPFRQVEDIKLCVEALDTFPSCTAVRKDYGYTLDEGARMTSLNQQDRVPRLTVTGSIYAVRVPAFIERRKLIIMGNINRGTYHLENGPFCDIDSQADYECAKALWAWSRPLV